MVVRRISWRREEVYTKIGGENLGKAKTWKT